jgi:hypothetical protein
LTDHDLVLHRSTSEGSDDGLDFAAWHDGLTFNLHSLKDVILSTDGQDSCDYPIFVRAFPTGEIAERIQAVRLRHD